MSSFTMNDFRAELHRRKHGEYYGPRQEAKPGKPQRRIEKPRRDPRESWPTYVDRLVTSVRTRLAELEQRSPADVIPCPWGAVFGGECLDPCRCEGKRAVTVGFMVAHYQLVLVEYEAELRRTRKHRVRPPRQNPHHVDRKEAGGCINGADHALPLINPRTGKPYTRCEDCRATHRESR